MQALMLSWIRAHLGLVAVFSVYLIGALLIARDGLTPKIDQGRYLENSVLLGQQAESTSAKFDTTLDGSLVIGYRAKRFLQSSHASWRLRTSSITRLAQNADDSKLFVVIDGGNLHSNAPNTSMLVLVNDDVVKSIDLNTLRLRNGIKEYLPSLSLSPERQIEYSPLDTRLAYEIEIPSNTLKNRDYSTIAIAIRGRAGIEVRTIGFILEYKPRLSAALSSPPLAYGLGAAVVIAMLSVAVISVSLIGRASSSALSAIVVLLLGTYALCTRDGWDFPLWINLSDICTFGGGSPSLHWTATPFWAFVPCVVSPIIAALFIGSSFTSVFATGLLFKLVIFDSFLVVAAGLTLLANSRRRQVAVILLTLGTPLPIAILGWGARDITASAFIVLSVFSAVRRHWILAQLLATFAISTDEYFLPLALLAPLSIGISGRSLKGAWRGLGLLLVTVGLISIQWALLPAGFRASVIHFRVNYDFGAATWQQMLVKLNLFPNPLLGKEAALFISLYLVVCAIGSLMLITALRKQSFEMTDTVNFVLPYVTLMTAGFYLSYSRVDPQEWFGIYVLFLVCVARGLLNGLPPLVFSFTAGLLIYLHFGFHEMLNPTLLQPSDIGVFSIRGPAEIPALWLVLCSLCICVYMLFRESRMFSRVTPVLALSCIGVITITDGTTFIASDVLLLAANAGLFVICARHSLMSGMPEDLPISISSTRSETLAQGLRRQISRLCPIDVAVTVAIIITLVSARLVRQV
jgi:hypothetical protein